MPIDPLASRLLEHEARSLLTRLARLRPYALHMPMVVAATISPAAQTQVESHMIRARGTLHRLIHRFLAWLRTPVGRQASPAVAQQRFTMLRLRFNAIISQFEIFKDVLAQRSEHVTGVWVAGLDDVAADALRLSGQYFEPPPVICYVDRGHGAAIRRARTRLPGGDLSPVAVIRVPRERLVGTSIGSSLVHEVGHQGAALLDLVTTLRLAIREAGARAPATERVAWALWERWISEIVADFWSVAKIGIASTLGLMGVVSLPRAFVFRIDTEDPHPTPWIRMWLSCGIGERLYPHPQWNALARLWEAFYPREGLDPERRAVLDALGATMPALIELLVTHRPASLNGRALPEALGVAQRQPARLTQLYRTWGGDPERMRDAPPTLVFAVLGQARADGQLTPEEESRALGNLLTYWAVKSALGASADCAARPRRLTVHATRVADSPLRMAI